MAVWVAALLVPGVSSAQNHRQASEKRRKHARAIPHCYIVVLHNDAVQSVAPERAMASLGATFTATYGAQIQTTYQHALRGYATVMNKTQPLALSHDSRVAYGEESSCRCVGTQK